MSTLWIIIAIAIVLIFIWLWMQPKQGAKASNAPRSTMPDLLPSGAEREDRSDGIDDEVSPDDRVAEVSPGKVTSPPPPLSPPPSPQSLESEIHQFLDSGQKILAIKRVREVKHWSLKEAKDYVESLQRHEAPQVPVPRMTSEPTSALRQEVLRLLAACQKVTAVKLVREQTHWHLREAKQYVDALQDEKFQLLDEAVSKALPDQDLKEEVKRLIDARQRFAAIERVRTVTGWELSQAMDYVSGLERLQDS